MQDKEYYVLTPAQPARRTKASAAQLTYLANHMKNHPIMSSTVGQSLQARASLEIMWAKLADELNALGTVKSVEKWKQAWRDLKTNLKKKVSLNSEGNGPLIMKELSQADENVLEVMGPLTVLSVEDTERTETQLKKCWDNIKTRRRLQVQARASQLQSVGKRKSRSTDEEETVADPLMPVKQEGDDDSDASSRDSDVAEVSLGSAASPPRRSSRLADEEPRPPPRTGGAVPAQERIQELHKLKVAERVWTLKTLRERHATAQLERERAQLERETAQLERDRAREDAEKAKLEREKAKFERDIAECQREKALIERNRERSPEERMQKLFTN